MNVQEIAYYARRKAGLTKEQAPNGVIVSALNALLTRYATHFPDTYITEATDTFSTADSSVALPADFQTFEEFRIGSYVYLLISEGNRRFESTGSKVCWIRESTLYWNPAASIGDTYKLRYRQDPTALTAMTDTPGIPGEYHRDLAIILACDLASEPSQKLVAEYAESALRFHRRPQKAYRNDYIGTVYGDEGDQYADI